MKKSFKLFLSSYNELTKKKIKLNKDVEKGF